MQKKSFIKILETSFEEMMNTNIADLSFFRDEDEIIEEEEEEEIILEPIF